MKFTKINIFRKKNMIMLMLIVLSTSSCKKGYFYDGINDDPSELQKPIPSNLLAGLIASTGYEWGGDASRFPSNFMQQTLGVANQSSLATTYQVSSDDVDGMWTAGLYGAIMTNANALIKVATDSKQGHYAAVGKIMMVVNLGLTTDLWGDVPYTEAFQGIANLQPRYDTQANIYANIDRLLNEAITSLATADGSAFQPGSEDILFKGDLAKWTRFAHSLKAKFYLHLAKQDKSNYAKALAEIPLGFAAGENAVVPFSGASVTSESPWYQFNDQRPGDIAFRGTIYDRLAAANDPRLTAYQTIDPDDGSASLGPLYGSPNSDVVIMSYDELKFIEAEAQLQGAANPAAAAAAYNAAVTANLQRTVKNVSYAATIAKTAGNITLNDIMTQKYYALFLSPEVWTDWRRTGLPVLTAAAGSALNGALPRSLPYPSGEQRYNKNAPKNTTLLRRVFWDVQ